MISVKLVCIKNIDSFNDDLNLTIGKVYDAKYDNSQVVYSSEGLYYLMKDDSGIMTEYHGSYFKGISEHREDKLNEIGVK
jgi:hypothetical protein